MESSILCTVNLALGPLDTAVDLVCLIMILFMAPSSPFLSHSVVNCAFFFNMTLIYGYGFLVLFQLTEMSRRLLVLLIQLLVLPWLC